ncbi:armadillo repeat-containing protein 5 [Aythya fuligula]|uniref:Armadillo repeat-containing protein 5 n=1 Tax=Aythya fuligula TaxID=219594 RepID=A0A6J3EHJ4_AYTFU|nr:armadillo repeat-containing protein 5 [Aythya fuligula]
MAEPLSWCVEALRSGAEPGLGRALRALRSLHTRNEAGAVRFRARGGLGPLLELLRDPQTQAQAQEGSGGRGRSLGLALSVLGNLCTEPGCRRQARSLGGVPRLVALLRGPGPESVRNRAARALANLALEPEGARDVLQEGECGPKTALNIGKRPQNVAGGGEDGTKWY